jgi:azurin
MIKAIEQHRIRNIYMAIISKQKLTYRATKKVSALMNFGRFARSMVVSIGIFGIVQSNFPNIHLAQAAPPKKGSKAAGQLQIGTKGEENLFDKTKLSAKPGATVNLTFKNSAKGMQHNFVLTEIGAAEEVANAGIQAGADKGWVPVGSPKVLAHTRLLNPGESETISFTAPSKAGDYPFICSFPGHYLTMKGILQVK